MLILSPFCKIFSKQIFIRRDVFWERFGQPGVIQEVFVIDILTGHISSPTAAAQGIGKWIGIEQAAAVGHGMGHVAVYPADVCLKSELDLAIVALAVDRSGVTLAREAVHLLHPFDHLAEIIPFPHGEDR